MKLRRRNWQPYALLFVLTLALRIATALPVERAGYMDASYTQHVAAQLAAGRGLVEEIVWNYLDMPRALPHPSNLYWLPLPALLAAPWMALFGPTYRAAQIPFVLFSSFVPLVAFYLAHRWSGRAEHAWAAGLLTAFSGFYTIYWVAPDNFTPYALTASVALVLCAMALEQNKFWLWLLTGVLIGTSHLSRADGLLLLPVVPLAVALADFARSEPRAPIRERLSRGAGSRVLRATAWTLAGYLVVMGPWFLRNLSVAGVPLTPGSQYTLFLRGYDELFRFKVQDLTLTRYLEWGAQGILGSKLSALGTNALVVLFGVLQIFLAPFALIGAWKLRAQRQVWTFGLYALVVYFGLSLVFTFPSVRGSMLHSASALVPFCGALVPVGLDAAVAWAAARRKQWKMQVAQRFFRWGAVALSAVLSLYLYASGIWPVGAGSAATVPLWNLRDREYEQVGQALDGLGLPRTEPALAIDPPSFVNDTGRRAIMIPTESVTAITEAAAAFGAHYLVLQYDCPQLLKDLYLDQAVAPGWDLAAEFRDGLGRPTYLYRIR